MNIVAYKERESFDPITGAEGILRQEWRVRLVKSYAAGELENAFGPDWRRYKPGATHVLEHRYIRRGTEEPWTPLQTANSREQALEYIDSGATPVDASLAKLEQKRAEYAAQQQRDEEVKRMAEHAASDRRRHKLRSTEAFVRLRNAPQYARLADRWNAWHELRGDDPDIQARVKEQDLDLYMSAVNAETVPAKAKAMKAFLAKYDKPAGGKRRHAPRHRRTSKNRLGTLTNAVRKLIG